jgi:hypothetical protein
MFDYQAGEKHKLTLIMAGAAGLMAGMFFTFLLMPTPTVPQHQHQRQAWMNNPDVTGVPNIPVTTYGNAPANPNGQTVPDPNAVDPNMAQMLIQQFLPFAWDLSANSAQASQERAILYMTPECASAYRTTIWTPTIAHQIQESSIHSKFTASKVYLGPTQQDGTVVVCVEGQQTLSVPNQGAKARPIKVQYIIRRTAEGLRIGSISEAG